MGCAQASENIIPGKEEKGRILMREIMGQIPRLSSVDNITKAKNISLKFSGSGTPLSFDLDCAKHGIAGTSEGLVQFKTEQALIAFKKKCSFLKKNTEEEKIRFSEILCCDKIKVFFAIGHTMIIEKDKDTKDLTKIVGSHLYKISINGDLKKYENIEVGKDLGSNKLHIDLLNNYLGIQVDEHTLAIYTDLKQKDIFMLFGTPKKMNKKFSKLLKVQFFHHQKIAAFFDSGTLKVYDFSGKGYKSIVEQKIQLPMGEIVDNFAIYLTGSFFAVSTKSSMSDQLIRLLVYPCEFELVTRSEFKGKKLVSKPAKESKNFPIQSQNTQNNDNPKLTTEQKKSKTNRKASNELKVISWEYDFSSTEQKRQLYHPPVKITDKEGNKIFNPNQDSTFSHIFFNFSYKGMPVLFCVQRGIQTNVFIGQLIKQGYLQEVKYHKGFLPSQCCTAVSRSNLISIMDEDFNLKVLSLRKM